MICILSFDEDEEISGWIIAQDVPDARRKADNLRENDLAAELYRMEFDPSPGKHELPTGHLMLVS